MAGSRLQANKPHKTRFASKSSRSIHKVSQKDNGRISKPDRSLIKGAKAARLQRCKMAREQKRAALLKEKRFSGGSSSPPRVVVLFGLSSCVNLDSLEDDLLSLLFPGENKAVNPAVSSPEYRLRMTVLKVPHGNLLACMEMAKVADLIAFVASASSSCDEASTDFYIDSFGSTCLSMFRALGLPSTAVLIRDLPNDLKKRNDLKKLCSSMLSSEFPQDCKFYSADTKEELHKFMWLSKEQRIAVPHWRNQRPYIMAQKVDLVNDDSNPGNSTLLLTGYLRARSLSVNQLVHVSGAGDFQLCKIEMLRDPSPLHLKKQADLMDFDEPLDAEVTRTVSPDTSNQETLLVENVPDPLAGEQTWPTEAELEEARMNQKEKMKKRRLPSGTSEYQAAWIVDEYDSDEDDGMVIDDRDSGLYEEEQNDKVDFDELASLNLRDSDEETEFDSMMMVSEILTKDQIEDEIRKIKEAHAEDEEFPDEVDVPLDVSARKRFVKYRGLKSFRTSSWDPKESLPQEYAKIFAFNNFSRTQKHVLARAQERDERSEDDCVSVGSYVRLHVKGVPIDIGSKVCMSSKTMPVIACGLMQHESKISVLHCSLKKHDSYSEPIKAKEELIFHVGFRQFVTRPIFSTDSINSDKSKMERFLHAGRFSIASIYAPICFLPLPVIALKSAGQTTSPSIAAVGSLRGVNPDKIILKRIILTGYPQRVSKSKASVRYMFHNPEDVKWFKPVEVWTKCGRRGRIKEPSGTHGVMKCLFNGVLQQHDTVCMSLYKRAYPKWPRRWFPLSEA